MVTVRFQQIASGVLFAGILLMWGSPPAAADLIGTPVTGTLNFDGNPTNFFDPANGFVPAGALNSSGPTVTIVDPGVEFQFNDGFTAIDADFGPSSLSIMEMVIQIFDGATGLSPFSMTFTGLGSAGALLNVEQLSSTFPELIVTFDANSISISTPPGVELPFPPNGTYSAALHITQAAAVEEPATLLLFLLPFAAFALRKHFAALR